MTLAGNPPYVAQFRARRKGTDNSKGVGRTGGKRFSSPEQAKAYLAARIAELGVFPFPLDLRAFGFYDDNTPGKGDSDRSGRIDAYYRPIINGKKTFSCPCSISLTLDPHDGKLIYWRIQPKLTVETTTASIIEAAARAKAAMIISQHRPSAGTVVKAELGYCWPDKSFGSARDYREPRKLAVRLAWKVSFANRGTYAYVDAVTGESLGGSFNR